MSALGHERTWAGLHATPLSGRQWYSHALGPSPTALILPKIGSRKQFLRGRNEEVGVHHARGLQGGTT